MWSSQLYDASLVQQSYCGCTFVSHVPDLSPAHLSPKLSANIQYITHTSVLQLSGAHPDMGVSAYDSLAAHVQAGFNEERSASD